MDSRLIFLHCRVIIGMVRIASDRACSGYTRFLPQGGMQVKPQGGTNSIVCGAEKSHAVTSSGDRTVNRHRWVGS